MNEKIILEMNFQNNNYEFLSSIESAKENAMVELDNINETIESINALKPNCDSIDYMLANCIGALSGLIDVFFVGKTKKSDSEKTTDKWFENRVMDFAKLLGWNNNNNNNNSLSSAISFLEKKFNVPYDQRGLGDSGSIIFGLNPSNHHFKSLAHNPTLLGLFFSILNQFNNTSSFVSEGDLISLEDANNSFELKGDTVLAKIFYGFINWFGHLISDIAGSSSSGGRGMGIPSPFLTWTNDIIVLKRSLGLEVNEFNKILNNNAMNIYLNGMDIRSNATQSIPVLITELLTRFTYSLRRTIKYLKIHKGEKIDFSSLWNHVEPFKNASIKHMLTIAHGTFCLLDISDATIRSINPVAFNVQEFGLRINYVGITRFSISLFGEANRAIKYINSKNAKLLKENELIIVNDYLDGLNILAKEYDDQEMLNFISDFKNSDLAEKIFENSIKLARLRKVPEEKILKNEKDIDNYFGGEKQ